MSYNYDDDDYNDFIERLKEYLKNDKGIVDFDIFFMDEPNTDGTIRPNSKGFKVSYHFEPGMDKPEVKIEGDFDPKKIRDYLKRLKFPDNPNFKNLLPNQPKTITVKNLSLMPNQKHVYEPYLEVNEFDDHVEIVVEAPGVEQGSIITSLSEDGRNLRISIKTHLKIFEKEIELPFVSSMERHNLEINNGIVSISMQKLSIYK